ncbi:MULTISPECIES: ABC transporter permease [Streptomyces]|uniref:ABC transporter permease n=1 Tax=Streptomyces TaxID=1883 RepID=UPI001670E73E|nr:MULTISPECIES: ABC transporter permease [Streptomyces]UFR04794.1 ABC transporter permease [Streptomyces sp. Go40/10]GGS43015.1 transport permease protein [Streptomyces cinerochromogenes]
MTTTLPPAPSPAAPTPGRAPAPTSPVGGARPGLRTFTTEVLAVLGRRLRRLRRGPGRAIGVVLNPLVSMVLLGYLFRDAITLPAGGSYVEYVFAGGAVQVGLACVGPTAVSMAMDLQGGIVDRFRSLPISRSAVPLGHTAADLLTALAALVVTTGAGLLLGWRSHTGLLPTLGGFALIAAFTYVMLWLGVLLATTLRSIETISVVAPFIVIVLPFLSSAFLSPQSMPGAVRPIAEWNPVSAVIAACRDLWGNPATTGPGYVGEHPLAVVAVTLGTLFAVCVTVSLRRFSKP